MSTSITSPRALNINYKISEVSSEEFTVVDNKIDQFNADQLAFIGITQFYKNYVIKDAEDTFALHKLATYEIIEFNPTKSWTSLLQSILASEQAVNFETFDKP